MDSDQLESRVKQIFGEICNKHDFQVTSNEDLIDNVDVIIDTLDELQPHFNMRFSNNLAFLETCKVNDFIEKIVKEVNDDDRRKRWNQEHKFIVIYAKLIENKATKEISVDGPFFGDVANNEEDAGVIAKAITERQQNNIMIKIYDRNDRSDTEIMNQAKRYFERIQKGN